jgi:hypothetical protein
MRASHLTMLVIRTSMLGILFLKLEAKENILMQEFYASGDDLKPVPVHTTLQTRLRRKN